MNNPRYARPHVRIILPLLLAILCLPSPSRGDGKIKTKKLVLYPAAAPCPALKYQLTPSPLEKKPGNAVVFYGKIKAEEDNFFHSKKIQDKLMDCLDAPLDELRDVREIDYLPSILNDLKRGVVCEDCDWQITIREDGFETLLPELQGSRQYARYLSILARKQIVLGKFDEAAETLKYGYTFGRHVADTPTIIGGLIGNAIIGIMSDALEELIQQPGAPNLYWALTYLPQPLINLRKNMNGEILGFYASFTELLDVDKPIESPDYWREQYWETYKTLYKLINEWGIGPKMPNGPPMQFIRAIKGYQIAKLALIERGMTPDEVEAMPVGRAILMASARIYEEMNDELLKCYFLPYWEADSFLDRVEKKLNLIRNQYEEPLPFASGLLPATRAARRAYTRLQQHIAVLRVLEAIRLYGAGNDGRLPQQLSDITEVPIPVDPVTGKPFSYKLHGNTGILETTPFPGWWSRYEIRFASKPTKK